MNFENAADALDGFIAASAANDHTRDAAKRRIDAFARFAYHFHKEVLDAKYEAQVEGERLMESHVVAYHASET